MPEQEKRIELGGSVWMTVGGESLGGSGRVQLLALVGEDGVADVLAARLGLAGSPPPEALTAVLACSAEI